METFRKIYWNTIRIYADITSNWELARFAAKKLHWQDGISEKEAKLRERVRQFEKDLYDGKIGMHDIPKRYRKYLEEAKG